MVEFEKRVIQIAPSLQYQLLLGQNPRRIGLVLVYTNTSSVALTWEQPNDVGIFLNNPWPNPWVVEYRQYGPILTTALYILCNDPGIIETYEIMKR